MEERASPTCVAALAGRRIDAAVSSISRFPEAEIPRVREAIRHLLTSESVTHMISSAAAGADLLGLQVADELGLWKTIILPYAVQDFRSSSVVDRPGNWGPLFDRIVSTVGALTKLVVLDGSVGSAASFSSANAEIISEAVRASHARPPIAVLVWDGTSRGSDDATAEFARMAMEAQMTMRTILTCPT